MTPTKEEFEKLAKAVSRHLYRSGYGYGDAEDDVKAGLQAVWSEVFPPAEGIPVRIAVAIDERDMVGTFSALAPVWTDDKLMREAKRDYTSENVTHAAIVSVVIPPIPAVPTVTGEVK